MTRMIMAAVLIAFMGVSSVFAAGKDVKVERLAKSDKMWDGTLLPTLDGKDTEVTVLRITIGPHVTLPMHKHPVINIGYMVSGCLTVHSKEGKTLKLKAGDPIIELVDKWHYGINDSDEPAVIVVVYVGQKEKAITVLDK